MAEPLKRDDLRWESAMAALALAGVRPLVTDRVAVGAGAAGSYTITDIRTKRAMVIRTGGVVGDIRIGLNAAPGANGFPLVASVYFTFEVEKSDVIHFHNNNAGALDVFIMEIR